MGGRAGRWISGRMKKQRTSGLSIEVAAGQLLFDSERCYRSAGSREPKWIAKETRKHPRAAGDATEMGMRMGARAVPRSWTRLPRNNYICVAFSSGARRSRIIDRYVAGTGQRARANEIHRAPRRINKTRERVVRLDEVAETREASWREKESRSVREATIPRETCRGSERRRRGGG